MAGEPDPTEHFTPLRPELIGLAYRMTGSLATAEDIAQEAFLRWNAADRRAIEIPRAWLLKATARLSLDHLKSARHRREAYVGPWLPEPVLDTEEPPQQVAHERAQDISVAFLLTLQRLSPAERAVFILHDLFETPFAEIAALLGRNEAACRKLATRAREHLGEARPRQAVEEAEARRIAQAFFAASRDGDEAGLRRLLAGDVVLHTDGGGIRNAARNLIQGAEKVGRFFAGIARKRPEPPPLLHLGSINTLPGFVTLEADGLPQTTALEVRDGRIVAIYIVRNPEKLGSVRARLSP
ncbi:sigma-70 family RNA polymerase sigma factor [Roseomonas sp. SSH11]|uniref:Sigma-70 family RNA polymerase sigma factor n=1 Tax=Pararoseomonas baculiformis TaxID=2820812 RepID=A0ABS4AC15_9PROT|nr:sigma-70 family RNA polymerase sigma factor [Pararoseomonas baculiformis]MBP0444542.1 sigma-70 family RNA polymerase sigma factor [Pararoseomonas baculiformis]